MSYPAVRAVILAGGFGTRIQHLLPDWPKPMALVDGRPFVEWILCFLQGGGVKDFVLSTGFRAEVIADYFAAHPLAGTRIVCVPEGMPLGTAGGFLNCIATDAPPDIWFVTNGDSLACAPLADFFDSLNAAEVSVLAVWQEDASRYGTLEIGEGAILKAFREKRAGSGWINAGVYLFRDAILARFPPQRPLSFETEVFPSLLDQGVAVKVHKVQAPFLDIGTPESLVQAEAFVRSNQNWLLSPPELA